MGLFLTMSSCRKEIWNYWHKSNSYHNKLLWIYTTELHLLYKIFHIQLNKNIAPLDTYKGQFQWNNQFFINIHLSFVLVPFSHVTCWALGTYLLIQLLPVERKYQARQEMVGNRLSMFKDKTTIKSKGLISPCLKRVLSFL